MRQGEQHRPLNGGTAEASATGATDNLYDQLADVDWPWPPRKVFLFDWKAEGLFRCPIAGRGRGEEVAL